MARPKKQVAKKPSNKIFHVSFEINGTEFNTSMRSVDSTNSITRWAKSKGAKKLKIKEEIDTKKEPNINNNKKGSSNGKQSIKSKSRSE